MQQAVVPIQNCSIEELTLPLTIIERDNYKVELIEMTPVALLNHYGITIQTNPANDNERQITWAMPQEEYTPHYTGYLAQSNQYLSITFEDNTLLPSIIKKLDFTMAVCLGRGIDYMKHITPLRHLMSQPERRGARAMHLEPTAINEEVVSSMSQIMNSDLDSLPKMEVIRPLVYSAVLQSGSSDVACVLYFSILESIYIQDSNPSEKTYKLTMRITKKFSKDYEFKSKLTKLYNKRSEVVHGSKKGNTFNHDEYEYLEGIVSASILRYLAAPEDFSQKELDILLLTT